MNVQAEIEGKEVARSLKILAPLIREDLRLGDEAAKEAAMPYYSAAGEKLIEARAGSNALQFWSWAKKEFKRSKGTLSDYMEYASASASGKFLAMAEPPSLRKFQRETLGRNRPTPVHPRSWDQPVKADIDRAKREYERIRNEELKASEEREAQRKLALRLIDIGYKVLAKELHPDLKLGSKSAEMTRLNAVRDRLKSHA